MNLDTKVEVSVGCLEFLTGEVESLRKTNEKLEIESRIVNRFLSLTESISPRNQSIGYGPDQMWQAKKEISAAIEAKRNDELSKQAAKAAPPVSNELVAEGCAKFN